MNNQKNDTIALGILGTLAAACFLVAFLSVGPSSSLGQGGVTYRTVASLRH